MPDVSNHSEESNNVQTSASSMPAEGQAELDAANAYMEYERTHFGRVDEPRFPLSRQIKLQMRKHFPFDQDFFQVSDGVQFSVMRRTLGLRAATFALMLLFLAAAHALYTWQFEAPADRQSATLIDLYRHIVEILAQKLSLPALDDFPLTIICLIAAGSVLFILRWILRGYFLGENDHAAAHYAYTANDKRQHIAQLIQDACHKSNSLASTEKRTVRARKWPKIAAWHARRSEAADRYATTVVWVIRVYFVAIELVFIAIKLAILAYFVSSLLHGARLFDWLAYEHTLNLPDGQQRLEFIVLLCFIVVLGWGPLFRSRNDAWSVEFKRRFSVPDKNVPHFFDAIAKVVEECVEEAIRHQENPEEK